MNKEYYLNLKRKIYRAHLLSLGIKKTIDEHPNADSDDQQEKNIYDQLEEEDKKGLLDWIKPQ